MKSDSCKPSCKPYGSVVASLLFWLILSIVLPAHPSASTTEYAIQIGVFKQRENALTLVSGQNRKGEEAVFYREERLNGGDLWYHVYLGRYKTWEAAERAARTFKKTKAIPATSFVSAIAGDVPKTDITRKSTVQRTNETEPPMAEMITKKKREAPAAPMPTVQAAPPPMTTEAAPSDLSSLKLSQPTSVKRLHPTGNKSTEYAIQIGVFKQRENALALVSSQNQKEASVFYREERLNGRDLWFHVYLGNYKTRMEAEKAVQAFKRQKTIPATSFVSTIVGNVPKTNIATKPEVKTARETYSTTDVMIAEKRREARMKSAPSAKAVPAPGTTETAEPTLTAQTPAMPAQSPLLDKRRTPREADSGKGLQSFMVKGFRLAGNKSISSADLQIILVRYIDRSCNLETLREAAGQLTEEYNRRGFSFAKAYVPAQEIENGIVNITIVESKIGEIQVEGNKNYSADFIRRFLKGDSGEALTGKKLERGLLILNTEFTDLKVSAALEPGREPGAVAIRTKVEDGFPLHLTLSANNYGSDFVGRYRYGAQIEWVNALIPGALLTAGGLIGDTPDRMAFGNAQYLIPVNAMGTKVGLNSAFGSFTVGRDFIDLGINNNMLSGGIFVTHPFIKTRTFNLSGELGFRSSDAKFYLMNAVTSYDKTRVLYLEGRSDHIFWGGKSFASLNLTQGLGNWLGGTSGNDPFASRQGADNDFTRFNLNIARQQPVTDIFSAIIRLSGQLSSDSLLAGEEWQIGGIDSVRGYMPGESSGDHGYKASLEFRAAPFDNKELFQFAAFIDHGGAYRRQVLVGSKGITELTGAGFGLYSRVIFFIPTDIRLDIGWPLKPGQNFLNDSPALYFSVSTRI
jgi:hemolysin activation/secretion protein/septal ring-binding cell division protein DamX